MIPHSSDPTPNSDLSSVQARSGNLYRRTVVEFCSYRIWKSSGVASHPRFC